MQSKIRLAALCGLMLLAAALAAGAAVTVEKIEYRGWQGSYRMTNGTVELVFVPQIGRIMRYAYVGGPNVFWENAALAGRTTDLSRPSGDWQNYGGDKLWPAPQSVWGWPPDPTFESGPHTVQVLPNHHLRIEGPRSRKWNLRFVREIALEAKGTGVTLKNTLQNLSEKPQTWSVWEIAQTDDPSVIRMPLYTGGRFPEGYHLFPEMPPAPESLRVLGQEVRLTRNPAKNGKVGGDSPQNWLAVTAGAQSFRLSAAAAPGKPYPDGGCAYEVYTSDDPNKYVELELLGPLQQLKPNASITLTTHWQLSRAR